LSRDIKTYSISYYFRIISFYFGYKFIRKRWFSIENWHDWLLEVPNWRKFCLYILKDGTDYSNITVITGINRNSKSFIKNGCKISLSLKSSSDLHWTWWSLNTLWTCLLYISLCLLLLEDRMILAELLLKLVQVNLVFLFRYRFFLRN